MEIIGALLRALVVLVICVSVAMFVVVPAVKFLLISAHESLSQSRGAGRVARRAISYPIVALLSRQRRARRADADATAELFVLAFAIGVLASVLVQGVLVTVLSAVVLWCLFMVGYSVLTT